MENLQRKLQIFLFIKGMKACFQIPFIKRKITKLEVWCNFPFSKRSQKGKAQPIPFYLADTFHSQNGVKRERRSQSLNPTGASLLASHFGNKKSQQTGGLGETFHSQNGTKGKGEANPSIQLAQACLQAILGNKKSQQTACLAGAFHSQNGAKREGRRQSLNPISASLLASYFG